MNHPQRERLFLTIFILLLPGAGYGIMRALVYLLPLSGNNVLNIVIFAFLIVIFGLLIPMWIVKLGIHVASLGNPREPELKFKNIPKDKEQLIRSQR